MRLFMYNAGSNSIDWYREQYEYFGQATTVAVGDWGNTQENISIYLGGAADDNRY